MYDDMMEMSLWLAMNRRRRLPRHTSALGLVVSKCLRYTEIGREKSMQLLP